MNPQDNKFKTIANYLFNAQKPFKIDDIFKSTGIKKTAEDKEEIQGFIDTTPDFVQEKNRYYPKSSFLKDIPIRIRPSEFEIKQKILIPGHRLLPFHPPGADVDDISLTYNEKPLKTKEIKLQLPDLLFYFNLMDFDKIPFINVEAILEPGADVLIEAFNLKKFYDDNRFKNGDSIILRSIDFIEGVFSLEYDPEANYQANLPLIQNLDRAFINMLKKVMDREIPYPNTENQLLYTYYHLKKAGPDTWNCDQAGTPLGPLLAQHNEILFSSLSNGKVIFHFSHQSLEDFEVYPDFDEIMEHAENDELDLDTINGILTYLNNSNGIATVRALLFRQITAHEDYNYKAVEDYLFDGLEKPYMPREFQKKFRDLVEMEYKQIKDSFDLKHAYLPITTLREKVLEKTLEIARFLRSLDAKMIEPDELPKKQMIPLMELDHAFYEVLVELDNRQLSGNSDASEIHPINKVIDGTENILPLIFASIREELGLEA